MAVKRWRAGHASSRQCGRSDSRAVVAAQASGGVPFWWLWWGRALTVCCVWWLSLPLMDCQAEEAPTPPSTKEDTGQHWTTTSEGHWSANSGVHWAPKSHPPLVMLAAEKEEEATGGAPTDVDAQSCSFHDWSTIWQPCKRKLRPGQTIHIRCPHNALYHPVDWRRGDTGKVCETPITSKDMQPYCAKPRKWWDTAPVATWATVLQDMSVQHTIVLLHNDDENHTVDGAAAVGPHQHDGPLTVHGACFGAGAKDGLLYWSIELLLPERSDNKNKNDDNKNDNKIDNKNDDNSDDGKNADTPTSCSFHDPWTISRPCKRRLRPGQSIHIVCPANALYPPVDWRRGDTGEVCAWPVMEKRMQPYCAKPLKWRDTAPVVVSANVQEDKTVQHTITLNNDDDNTADRAAAAAGPHQHDGPLTVHGACFGAIGKKEFLYWSIELMLPKKTEDKNKNAPPHRTTITPTLRFDQSERKEDEVVTVALRQGDSFEVACDEGATVDPPDALTPNGGHFCRSLAVASPRPCPTAAAALWSSVDAAVKVAAAAAAVDDAAKKTTTAKGVKATIVAEGRPKEDGNAAAFSCTRKDGVMTVFFLFFQTAAAVGTPPPPSSPPSSPSSPSSLNLAIRSLKRCPTTTHDDDDDNDDVNNGKEIFRVRRGAGHRHHQSDTKEKKKEGTVAGQLEELCDVALSPNDVLAIDCYDRPELVPADVASPAGSFCAKPFPWPKDWKCEGGDLVRWQDVLEVRLAGGGEPNDEGMFAVVNTTTKQTPFVAYGRCYNSSTGGGLSIAATFLPQARPDDDEKKKEKTTKTTVTENSADNKTTTNSNNNNTDTNNTDTNNTDTNNTDTNNTDTNNTDTNNTDTNNTTHDSDSIDEPSSSVREKGSTANASPPSLLLAAALSAVLAAVAGGL